MFRALCARGDIPFFVSISNYLGVRNAELVREVEVIREVGAIREVPREVIVNAQWKSFAKFSPHPDSDDSLQVGTQEPAGTRSILGVVEDRTRGHAPILMTILLHFTSGTGNSDH
ncbi:hypothetical protein ColTof4_09300 [Colletotrichum tofieldiae]|nr:hypothetical protein ColTof3_12583 [Colletotrichum tofieldiae]GKT76877.1 hypothetical protein ColTof4_09300 [Colletotrichum tofieldiae]GKT92677.1 hypothetical protein Ct61P_10527 [Colletotrichum tofieldiae]